MKLSRFICLCFKSVFFVSLLLGVSLRAMSEKEREVSKALEEIARDGIEKFDATQGAEKQWEFFRALKQRLDGRASELMKAGIVVSQTFKMTFNKTTLVPLAKKFAEMLIRLHGELGSDFFKNRARVQFSREFIPGLILSELSCGMEAATMTRDRDGFLSVARKAIRLLALYATVCRAVGIGVRHLKMVFEFFRSLLVYRDRDREATATFLTLIFPILQQNNLVGAQECDEIIYTYAEIDGLVGRANDPELRAYVDWVSGS